jgi:PIN domain nuclease of toxin-antitoxin system
VLDASAALAVLKGEPGGGTVLSSGLAPQISTVNLAEVYGRLIQLGMQGSPAWEAAHTIADEIVPFTQTQARLTAELFPRTRSLGLGLGDRACLALGIERKLPVLTADKAWKALRLGVEIRVIR